ncbi:MAG: prepilin-type N-terminal cleavage/methylation protein [Conexibacter sp.]|nr:prepilin-type N-terminal cleavage/methylation protein [Conexibacter sp.]
MTRRLSHAARDEAGFSLIELLVALAIGSIVLTAVMTVFINGLTGSAKVTDRVEAAQRARVTADRISTLLQAEICGTTGDAPISDASATSVTFTANLGDVYADPIQYRIRWDSATKSIFEDRYVSTDGGTTFPAAPTSSRLIGTNMVPTDGSTLFKYYGFDTVNGGIAPTPMSPIDVQQIIAVNFYLTAMPERTKQSDPRATSVEGQAVAGSADPSDPNLGTKC